MAFLPIPVPQFPNVPDLPGVPPLVRDTVLRAAVRLALSGSTPVALAIVNAWEICICAPARSVACAP